MAFSPQVGPGNGDLTAPGVPPRSGGRTATGRPGRRAVGVAATVGLTGLLLTSAASPAWAHSYSYTVETRGAVTSDVGRFAAIARSTLADARGWSLGGAISYRQVRSGGRFRLVLATPGAVEAASPGCSARWSCRVGDLVLINERRWNTGTAAWRASLHEYRQYVINHEVGHWLGLGHRSCPKAGSPAPVMQQQSIRLDGCTSNTWPLPSERSAVARAQGVSSKPVSTRPQVPATGGLIKRGDRGPAVGEWQRQLNRVRARDIAVDSVFGARTQRATQEFQRQQGLVVDGIVGPRTRAAMRAALS